MNDKIIKYLREDCAIIKELHERTKITLDDILNGNITVRVPELLTGENLPTVDFWGITTSYEGLNEDEYRRIYLGKAEHLEEVFHAALQVLFFNLNTSSLAHQYVGEHLKLIEERSYRMNISQGAKKANKASQIATKANAEDRRSDIEWHYFHTYANKNERNRATAIAKDLSISQETVRRHIRAIKKRRAEK